MEGASCAACRLSAWSPVRSTRSRAAGCSAQKRRWPGVAVLGRGRVLPRPSPARLRGVQESASNSAGSGRQLGGALGRCRWPSSEPRTFAGFAPQKDPWRPLPPSLSATAPHAERPAGAAAEPLRRR
jgi:hypothetical protein